MSTRAHVLAWFAHTYMQTCLATLFALDQEPDDVIVARRCSGKALEKTLRACSQAAAKQADTRQKIKEQVATDKQKTAAAPAKEGPPVKRCTVSFPGACVVLVSAAFFFAITMALWSNSSISTGAAEVVTTKTVSSWADASNDRLCDNGVHNFTAAQEAFETTSAVRLDFLPT